MNQQENKLKECGLIFKCPACKLQTVTPVCGHHCAKMMATISPYCPDCDDEYMDYVQTIDPDKYYKIKAVKNERD